MVNKKEVAKFSTETAIGALKGLVGAIPVFGDAINEALFGINERIQQSRVNDFVEYLKSQVLELQLTKVDEEYFKSEDFYDLTRIIFESVIKTKSKEKHLALSKVYLSGIIENTNIENEMTSIFSKFIVDLMPLQIRILLFIEKNEQDLANFKSFHELHKLFTEKNNNPNVGIYELNYFCNDLVNKSLISFGKGLENYDSVKSLSAIIEEKYSSAKLTSLGLKFIQFLKEK